MAECHAALIGGVFGCTGPLLSHGLGRAAGWSPDNTGQRVILRQPVGPPCLLIALFGALASSATAAFAALAAQSSLFGAGAGAVTACFVAGLSTADMLKRRNLLATEPASRHRRTK
ncbi:unnamed protein product [Durusdinium trenchii]|uniref:Sulphur transport domain-containing protein n=1 Tax=Durusdinium trenchii TaxID=1381693 RepID=A0ABP0Q341_9DINO